MKNNIKIILFIAVLFIHNACTDLDVQPEGKSLAADLFKNNPKGYRQYLAKLYGAFSLTGQKGPAGDGDIKVVNDEGFTSYIRAYWKAQELTTDEAVIAWTDAGIRDLHSHSWSSENQFVKVLYYRIFFIITYCNDFLEQSTADNLTKYNIPSDGKAKIDTYRAEARFLRALAYWHALDLFRNVPILTKISSDIPSQSTPQQIFDFIDKELKDIEDKMTAPKKNEYGRADRAALWMLQAKLYLNAEVYLGKGQPKYTECITAIDKVIGAGYQLSTKYNTLFMADNHTSSELIFTLISDGQFSQSWGSTTFLVNGAIGGSMKSADYGVSSGWAGLRTTKTMLDKFGGTPQKSADPRAIFYTKGQSVEIDDVGKFEQGIAVPKYTNLKSNGEEGSHSTHCDTDYPMFRLGDAYLMYAEAVLRGGTGGSRSTALQYINSLRKRAFGDNTGNITDSALTLDFILDERTRELYWEATRRVDLIRYERFTTKGIWPWKGGVKQGKTTEAFRNLFPIPADDLNANPKLTQNKGY